jgi:hypothetical protein
MLEVVGVLNRSHDRTFFEHVIRVLRFAPSDLGAHRGGPSNGQS